MDIGRELVALRKKLEEIERAARLKHASIDDTSIEVRDDTGSLRALVGMQADGTTAVNVVNGPPPPQPTTPVVASVLGGVTASWDGAFADGSPVPLDFSRIEVHASTSSGFTPDTSTLKATIESPQAGTAVVVTDDPVYVRLMARSTSGTASTPSDQTGPAGPTEVVASDVLDGIITTVKLADDAVTQAKVAAGAIGTTEISDDAVTTPKIIAGAVQTAQIAADAVNASKIAAGAITTGKLDALAVTTDKIAANAITVAKLAAGSVDATALAADAITGKTITGGTITGTVVTGGTVQTATSGERITLNESSNNKIFIYDSSGNVVGAFTSGGLSMTSSSTGSIMALSPATSVPSIRWTTSAQTKFAKILSGTTGTSDLYLQLQSSRFTASSITDWIWNQVLTNDHARIERTRDDGTGATLVGARLLLNSTIAEIGYRNTDDTTQETILHIETGLAYFSQGRLQVLPPASSNSALYVNPATGHTGNLLRLSVNATDKLTVDKDGNTSVAGTLAVTGNTTLTGTLSIGATTWGSWTPVINNGGTATFSVRDGWYVKYGKDVHVYAYITCSGAGSGTTGLTISGLPSTPYRGSSDRRQYIGAYLGGLAAGTNSTVSGHGVCLIQPTGSGSQFDQVRGPTDIQTRGENLSATATLTINGWYREA
jgi:hypothetical protein